MAEKKKVSDSTEKKKASQKSYDAKDIQDAAIEYNNAVTELYKIVDNTNLFVLLSNNPEVYISNLVVFSSEKPHFSNIFNKKPAFCTFYLSIWIFFCTFACFLWGVVFCTLINTVKSLNIIYNHEKRILSFFLW